MATNLDHEASEILSASLWFLTMFATRKSSMQMMLFSRIRRVDNLCRKSSLLLVIRSEIRANLVFALTRLLLPFSVRESLLWAERSFLSNVL